jgi:hypothetical protein
MADFNAYLWLRSDGSPYYAGQGTRRRALYTHHRKIKAPLDRSLILIFPRNSRNEALRTEAELIRNWGRLDIGTGCLLNQSDGGFGGGTRNHCALGPHRISLEGLQAMISANKRKIGRKNSPETIERMRTSAKRRGYNRPGYRHSEATKAKMRKPHMNRGSHARSSN